MTLHISYTNYMPPMKIIISSFRPIYILLEKMLEIKKGETGDKLFSHSGDLHNNYVTKSRRALSSERNQNSFFFFFFHVQYVSDESINPKITTLLRNLGVTEDFQVEI